MTGTGTREDDAIQRRIVRARELAGERPASAEILGFYADLAAFQRSLAVALPRVTTARGGTTGAFVDALDAAAAARLVPDLLAWLGRRHGRLAGAARSMRATPPSRWQGLLAACWAAGGADDLDDTRETERFVVEAVLQPFAEAVAAACRMANGAGRARGAPSTVRPIRCPACGGKPLAATLRERGHGLPRALVCGFCLIEWPALRIECPACGEHGFETLPVFRAEQFAGVRVDACDACGTYVKTLDLAASTAAIPIVDDLATLPLDLWAAEQGYRRMRPNLLRL